MKTFSMTESIPTWVSRPGRALDAQVHLPRSTMARGVVVLAPPIAREWTITYRPLRALACRLADEGFVAVRFAFTQDGDSGGSTGDDVPQALAGDLQAVIEMARTIVPGAPLGVVGLRMGAAVAAMLPPQVRGELLAWEPVSPRRWLRGQSAIRRLAVSTPLRKELGTEIIGRVYSAAQISSLRALKQPDERTPACTLRQEEKAVANALYATDVAHATTPFASFDEIVDWAPRGAPMEIADWQPVTECLVDHEGILIRQEYVHLTQHGLPAVVTSPSDGDVLADVLLAQGSMEPRCGPGNMWASVSAELAAVGARTIRVDRRGTGELSDPGIAREPSPYSSTGITDYVDVVRQLRGEAQRPLVAAGVCAGAWYLARAAASGGIDRVLGFNNPVWGLSPTPYRVSLSLKDRINSCRGVFDLAGAVGDGGDGFTGDNGSAPQAEDGWQGRGRGWPWRFLGTVARSAAGAVPPGARRAAARFGVASDPALFVLKADPGTELDFYFGADDWPSFLTVGGQEAFRQARAAGRRVSALLDPELDHGLLSVGARHSVESLLLEAVSTQRTRRGEGTSLEGRDVDGNGSRETG